VAKLYKQKNSRYWWATGRDHTGQRWFRSTKQVDKRAAAQAATRIEAGILAGEAETTPGLTIEGALIRLLERDEVVGVSKHQYAAHENRGRNLIAFFGPGKVIAKMREQDAYDYWAHRKRHGISAHTVRKELGTLVQAVKLAARSGYRPAVDPSSLVPEELRRGAYKPVDRWIDVEQLELLLSVLTPERQDYVVMWTHTGMDLGELPEVKPADVDLQGNRLHIRGTKTAHRDRKVPLSSRAREILTRRMDERRDPLFAPWTNARRDLGAACAKAGVPRVTPKDLRRTFASILANEGVSSFVAAKLMGHGSTEMVERVYAQLGDRALDSAIGKLSSVTEVASTRGMEPASKLTPCCTGDAGEHVCKERKG